MTKVTPSARRRLQERAGRAQQCAASSQHAGGLPRPRSSPRAGGSTTSTTKWRQQRAPVGGASSPCCARALKTVSAAAARGAAGSGASWLHRRPVGRLLLLPLVPLRVEGLLVDLQPVKQAAPQVSYSHRGLRTRRRWPRRSRPSLPSDPPPSESRPPSHLVLVVDGLVDHVLEAVVALCSKVVLAGPGRLRLRQDAGDGLHLRQEAARRGPVGVLGGGAVGVLGGGREGKGPVGVLQQQAGAAAGGRVAARWPDGQAARAGGGGTTAARQGQPGPAGAAGAAVGAPTAGWGPPRRAGSCRSC